MTKMQDKAALIAPIERGVLPLLRSKTTSFGKKISLSASIRALKEGESFQIDDFKWRRRVTATAHYLEIPVRTEKLDGGKLRVERV